MKNEATTILELLSGKLYMTYIPENDCSMAERNVRFLCNNDDVLEGYVSMQVFNGIQIKNAKRICIPLDFEEIDGMQAMLKLLAAFACPEHDAMFYIYKKSTKHRIASYAVNRLEEGSREIIKIN